MKVAVFHSFLDNIGGAEMVALTLAKELNADIYTTNVDWHKIKKMGFADVNVFSIGNVPRNAPLRHQLTLWRFSRLRLGQKYDYYIIAGDWAISGAKHNQPNLWYVHSPMREIWDLYQHTRRHNVPLLLRIFFDLWVSINRLLVKRYLRYVGKLVCNSANTQTRIKKYLKKTAKIIWPPVDTANFFYRENGNFWLSVNRLINHKRVDIQLEAFANMPDEQLIIVGSYEKSRHFEKHAASLKNIKRPNVEFRHWVDKTELIDLYANCKGFITTSLDEDFGMAAVEALAAGKPVIAPDQGGYRETIDNSCGKLLSEPTALALVAAVKEISPNTQGYRDACLAKAKNFDTRKFVEKIKTEIKYER